MNELAGFAIDLDLLRAFERGLDPQHPERSAIPAQVLGYGEISTVLEIRLPPLAGLAFKRLPLFHTWEEVARYRDAYVEYNRLLEQAIGLSLPAHGYAAFANDAGQPRFYIIQEQLPAPSIGSRAIHLLTREGVLALVRRVLEELGKVWAFNRAQERLRVAIDPQNPQVKGDTRLLYLDTSTPLFRVGGAEQLDPELFLRSAPSFLAWALRLLYLKEVVDRYYDLRKVVTDLVANFFKEQRAELVGDLVTLANGSLAGEGAAPISEQEVSAYYRQDATIWSLYLAARQIDRALRTRLLRREYPYVLPGKIRR